MGGMCACTWPKLARLRVRALVSRHGHGDVVLEALQPKIVGRVPGDVSVQIREGQCCVCQSAGASPPRQREAEGSPTADGWSEILELLEPRSGRHRVAVPLEAAWRSRWLCGSLCCALQHGDPWRHRLGCCFPACLCCGSRLRRLCLVALCLSPVALRAPQPPSTDFVWCVCRLRDSVFFFCGLALSCRSRSDDFRFVAPGKRVG